MVARFAGASLGLVAFIITITAGLLTRNPVEVTLSRSIFALILFCLIGLLLGTAAQLVVAEYEKNREAEIHKRYHDDSAGTKGSGPNDGASGGEGESIHKGA